MQFDDDPDECVGFTRQRSASQANDTGGIPWVLAFMAIEPGRLITHSTTCAVARRFRQACSNCYADSSLKTQPFDKLGVFGSEASGGTRVVASEAMWRQPLTWNQGGGSRWDTKSRFLRFACRAVICQTGKDSVTNSKGETLVHPSSRICQTKRLRLDMATRSCQPSVRDVCNGWRMGALDDVRRRLFEC